MVYQTIAASSYIEKLGMRPVGGARGYNYNSQTIVSFVLGPIQCYTLKSARAWKIKSGA